MMKAVFVALLFLASILGAPDGWARSRVPLVSPHQAAIVVSGDRVPSLAKIHDTVLAAASGRHWEVVSDQSGEVTLRNVIRGKHAVVIKVSYDNQSVRAEYVSSENMDYEVRDGVAYIHPKYNLWVAWLLADIVGLLS
jgi:hypothetical protein